MLSALCHRLDMVGKVSSMSASAMVQMSNLMSEAFYYFVQVVLKIYR